MREHSEFADCTTAAPVVAFVWALRRELTTLVIREAIDDDVNDAFENPSPKLLPGFGSG